MSHTSDCAHHLTGLPCDCEPPRGLIRVLDHGHVSLVEAWGSDERIIEAARMSTGGGFKGWGPTHAPTCPYSPPTPMQFAPGSEQAYKSAWADCNCKEDTPGDEKLLRFLWANKHHTPFEMCGATFAVKAPIFVFREWHRHRTQSYNEMSARYTPLPDENYVPTRARCSPERTDNKQAQGHRTAEGTLTEGEVEHWLAMLMRSNELAQEVYARGLALGIPKELARLPVPVGRYSVMRASANLRNWIAFLKLRMAPNAQWEIRQYANAVNDLLSSRFPRTWDVLQKEGM